MNASSRESEIVLTWNPPAEIHQNGIITRYKISVINITGSKIHEKFVFGNLTTNTLSKLQPHTNYTISVSAATSEGFGPATSISVATRQVCKWTDVMVWFGHLLWHALFPSLLS